MGFGWNVWPNVDLYVWFRTHLSIRREFQSLGETDLSYSLPLISTQKQGAHHRSQAKCRSRLVASFTYCWSLLGPHTFFRSPWWTWEKRVDLDFRKVETGSLTQVSMSAAIPSIPGHCCKNAPRDDKHTPSWISSTFFCARDRPVRRSFIVPKLCPGLCSFHHGVPSAFWSYTEREINHSSIHRCLDFFNEIV